MPQPEVHPSNVHPFDSRQREDHLRRAAPPSVIAQVASGQQTTFLERFINGFFHENNIRWMLVIGAAIVFASSLMLVTHQWSTWSVTVRYLTIVAYTSATYVFSEFARRHLGLRSTANVLQALTLLLLPIPFLSLQWLGSTTWMGMAESALHAVLLILPTTVLTWFLSNRIFENLLRGKQRTFHICYCLLCVAGAMPALNHLSSIDPSLAPWLAAAISAGLWLVMTVGVIKVNRHVFWLAEEHRLPRVFGFFPIGLLGGQFLSLLACKTASSIHMEWLGFGCVLLAATIFATARSVAHVFKQRTGDLVRPLPWPIVLPIFVALAISALGVGISFFEFSVTGPTSYAVVPTSALAAVVLLWAAKETRHSGFTWCGLILVALAYQCAPTLVADLVASLKSSAAAAVGEDRLPVAFYGLTYLPLLVLFAIASREAANRGRSEFSWPLQMFVTCMSLALLGLSLTHLKASLPVAVISIATFTAMSVLFRDRRYILGSIAATTIAAITLVPFVNAMHWAALPESYTLLVVSSLVGLITLAAPLDQWILNLPVPSRTELFGLAIPNGKSRYLLQPYGVFLGCATSLVWVATSFFTLLSRDPQWDMNVAGGILVGSLAVQTVQTKRYALGLHMWTFAAIAGLVQAFKYAGDALAIVSLISIAMAVVATVSWAVLSHLRLNHCSFVLRALSPYRNAEVSRLTGNPTHAVGAIMGSLCDVSLLFTLYLAGTIHLPLVLASNVLLIPLAIPVATNAVLIACLALAGGSRSRVLTTICVSVSPLALAAIALTLLPGYAAYSLLPFAWSLSLAATLYVGEWLIGGSRGDSEAEADQRRGLGIAIRSVSSAGLSAILVGSAFYLDLLTLFAAAVAIAMLWHVDRRSDVTDRAGLNVLAHVWSFYAVEVALGNCGWVWGIGVHQWLRSIPYLMPLIVIGAIVFDAPWTKFTREITVSWTVYLRTLFVVGAIASLLSSHWQPVEIGLLVASMIGMGVGEFYAAIRRQRVPRLWAGVGSIVLTGAFLAVQRVAVVGMVAGQIGSLAVAILVLALSRRAIGHPHLGFAAETFQRIGLVIPGCVVLLRLLSSCHVGIGLTELQPQPAVNTLTMLTAAAIYFHHGTVNRQRQFVMLALGIVNLALALAWTSLQWYDLQLYLVPLGVSIIALVELLRREIPSSAHDTLRYVGALTILVSPMLEILSGSWWHLLSLLVLCVCVVLASIGLRLRALMFTGSAFLCVDLGAMVIHSSFDHPQLLWIAGLAIGGGVIALAAICENQRERLLERIRLISTELSTWH